MYVAVNTEVKDDSKAELRNKLKAYKEHCKETPLDELEKDWVKVCDVLNTTLPELERMALELYMLRHEVKILNNEIKSRKKIIG